MAHIRRSLRASPADPPRSVTQMAGEPSSEAKVRLFVALDLPEPVRAAIAAWQAQALADPALRPMRPQALHVTLCFLASHAEKAIARIAEVVASVPVQPIEMRFEPEPRAVPRGRPGLYTISAESPAAKSYRAELSQALEQARFYTPEKRAFWPHVTVARVRSERLAPAPGKRRGKGRPRRVVNPPASLPEALTEPFGAVRVALYRSNLKPEGAQYESLAGIDLPLP